jgi:hypothetical protein
VIFWIVGKIPLEQGAKDYGEHRQAAGAIAQLLASRDGAYYLPSGVRTPIQASRTC